MVGLRWRCSLCGAVWAVMLAQGTGGVQAGPPPTSTPAPVAATSAVSAAGAAVERTRFADGLYSRGMYELAAKEYETLLRETPDGEQADVANFRLGECYLQMGEPTRAQQFFGIVFSKFPKSALRFKAGFRRAEIFRDAGQEEAAVDLFGKVLAERAPADIASAALYSLADMHRKAGRKAAGVKTLEELVAQYGNSSLAPYARLRLGEAYAADDGTLDKAVEAFAAVEAKGASERLVAEALYQRAEALFRRKAFDQSWDAFDRLFSRYPADERVPEARLHAAWAAHNAGRWIQALGLTVETLDGTNRPATAAAAQEWLYVRANCERQLKRDADALRSYEALTARDEAGVFVPAARYEMGLLLSRMGRPADAVKALEQSLPALADKTDAYWLLAEALDALKRGGEAANYYRRIVQECGKSDRMPDAMYRLAEHRRTGGERREASELFEGLATRFPENRLTPMALFAAGTCRFQMGEYDRAADAWGQLLSKWGAHELALEAQFLKGLCEVRLKRDEAARASLEAFVRKYADSPFAGEARYWLAVLHKDGGRLKEAELELREALRITSREEVRREGGFLLGRILYESGRKEEALSTLKPLLGTDAEEKMDAPFLRWMARAWAEANLPADAERAAALLVKKETDAAWLQFDWMLLGRVCLAQKKTDAAAEAFRRSLASGQAADLVAEAAVQLGDMSEAKGDHKAAAEYYNKAAEAASGDELMEYRARAQMGMGYAARGIGDATNAARYFMMVGLLYDDANLSPRSLREAVTSFSAIGRTGEAAKAQAELETRYPDKVAR